MFQCSLLIRTVSYQMGIEFYVLYFYFARRIGRCVRIPILPIANHLKNVQPATILCNFDGKLMNFCNALCY